MRIDQTNRPASGDQLRVRRRQSGFAVPEDGHAEITQVEDGNTGHAASAADIAAISVAVLAPDRPQGDGRMAENDNEAALGGDELLRALAGLQLATLDASAGNALARLATLAAGLRQAPDPALQAVLDGISARAAVALALAK